MLMNIRTHKVDQETLFALQWKRPDKIDVVIKQVEGGYFAKIVSITDGNVVTQANSPEELFEMVNDALNEYLEIPTQYRQELGYFMPPQELRHEFATSIPKRYLNRSLSVSLPGYNRKLVVA
jgi:predicted RNase H-like HicB family nuclease